MQKINWDLYFIANTFIFNIAKDIWESGYNLFFIASLMTEFLEAIY